MAGCGDVGGNDLDLGDLNFDDTNQNFNNSIPLSAFLDSYEGREDTILMVDELFGLLANDDYPIFDTEIIYPFDTVQGGFLEGFQNGSFTYEPPAGYTGEDSFTYILRDSQGRTSSAEVYIQVLPAIP